MFAGFFHFGESEEELMIRKADWKQTEKIHSRGSRLILVLIWIF